MQAFFTDVLQNEEKKIQKENLVVVDGLLCRLVQGFIGGLLEP
jgi:hypothetical protein